MPELEDALADLGPWKAGESYAYTATAKKFGCNRSTLSRRHRGVCASRADGYAEQRHLNTTQEKELVNYIDTLCKRGLPPTREMIRNFAAEIAKKYVGKCWADRFIERHRIHLLSRWTLGKDSLRHKADSAYKYELYFSLLKEKFAQYDIQPSNMYNMDEKGFLIGVLSKMKRVFSRARYESGEMKTLLQDGNREWITLLACICADGSALTPALIYQSAASKLRDSWLQDFNPSQHRCFFTSSPSGWTNNNIGLAWLEQVFNRETKQKARRQWRLLILDGHGSHVTMKFIEFCDAHKILLLIYPPHSTHTLQPLDVVMFSPLAGAYSRALAEFMDKCQGLSSITKRDFFSLFYIAWEVSFHQKSIVKAFECTGLVPFEPQKVLSRFQQHHNSRPSTSDSTTSVVSASDWRKIERLLRAVVEDVYDRQSAKLSQTIHTIAVQKQLLQHENERLKAALINEKKRRNRGKPLLLEPADLDNGGAKFYSPMKIQQAREKQQDKDLEEQQQLQQKAKDLCLREEQKQLKQQLLDERKFGQVQAKKRREAVAAEKALEKEQLAVDRELAKQLRDDLQLSKRGKKQNIKVPKAQKPAPAPVVVAINVNNGVGDLAEPVAPATSTTRSGRTTRLPSKYK